MGDKSPKAKQRAKSQKNTAKTQANDVKAKRQAGNDSGRLVKDKK